MKMYDVVMDFKEGRTPFYKGERVAEVNFEEGRAEFCRLNGWIAREGETPVPAKIGVAAELAVDTVTTKVTSNKEL